MTERRFWFVIDDGKLEYVQDLVTGEKITVTDLEDLLNEQQATIEQLQAKLKEKEEDEKLYANEIVELRKTNEEWLQFKELGGDY